MSSSAATFLLLASGITPFLCFTEPVASLTHLGGAIAALILLPFLLRAAQGERVLQISLGTFGLTVVGLLTVSGLYHLFPHDSAARILLRRMDHVGIWLVTAGCSTPIWYFYLRKTRIGTPLLVLVWASALASAVLKTIYLDALPPWAGVLLFVGFGAMGIPVVIWLVVKRGLYYTLPYFLCGVSLSIGALLEMIEEPTLIAGVVEYHEVVHVFVMAGLFFHWGFLTKVTVETRAITPTTPVRDERADSPSERAVVAQG